MARAVSTAYYAMFHALAKECANLLVGTTGKKEIPKAWSQAYRSLVHHKVKDVCRSNNSRIKRAYKKFPPEVQGFADVFCLLQDKRISADYDPLSENLITSSVQNDIRMAERAIQDFKGVDRKHKRAFCVFVTMALRT